MMLHTALCCSAAAKVGKNWTAAATRFRPAMRAIADATARLRLPAAAFDFRPDDFLGRDERNFRVALRRRVLARRIGEDQRVVSVGVTEVVVDALFFEEAAHEVEVRLAVLDHVLVRVVAAGQLVFEVGEAAGEVGVEVKVLCGTAVHVFVGTAVQVLVGMALGVGVAVGAGGVTLRTTSSNQPSAVAFATLAVLKSAPSRT